MDTSHAPLMFSKALGASLRNSWKSGFFNSNSKQRPFAFALYGRGMSIINYEYKGRRERISFFWIPFTASTRKGQFGSYICSGTGPALRQRSVRFPEYEFLSHLIFHHQDCPWCKRPHVHVVLCTWSFHPESEEFHTLLFPSFSHLVYVKKTICLRLRIFLSQEQFVVKSWGPSDWSRSDRK